MLSIKGESTLDLDFLPQNDPVEKIWRSILKRCLFIDISPLLLIRT